MFFWVCCFFFYPMDVGNLTSSSSAFSKSSLFTWKFSVHVLLKPSLKDFAYNLASMWKECNGMVVWTFFDIALFGDWNENWPFQSCGHCWVFQTCWHIECSTFTVSSFRIWNSARSQHGESHTWQRSWGKEPDKTQRRDQASGVPLDFLKHLLPKPESACFTVLCFSPTRLTLTGGCPPTTFLWKKLI